MQDILYYTNLFDLYGELLTEKQQNYFKEYYFLNFSLQEIADHYQVTRNAIFNQLKEVREALIRYEAKLHLLLIQEKLEELKKITKEEKEIIDEIIEL